MNLNDFMKEAHENAVQHGFWDEKRPIEETIALIHSEWSEALEEYRADRPMYYKVCKNCGEPCMKGGCGDYNYGKCELNELDPKPEGIAVELIDGVIRIMDYLGAVAKSVEITSDEAEEISEYGLIRSGYPERMELPVLIGILHAETSTFLCSNKVSRLLCAVGLVFRYIRQQGLDPEFILREKHEYNKTRPYKHGKVC